MANRLTYDVVPGQNDPVRIVPLSFPPEMVQPTSDAAPALAQAANLTYRGDTLLTAVEIVTIFWGAAWETTLEPYPGCAGCRGGLSPFDALTTTCSHELSEAITDPVPGRGWYDDVHGEIGDICAWKTKKLGAYTIQFEWSNAVSGCV